MPGMVLVAVVHGARIRCSGGLVIRHSLFAFYFVGIPVAVRMAIHKHALASQGMRNRCRLALK